MKDRPVISVGEARKLLGADAKSLSDDQVIDLVALLTALAQHRLSVNDVNSSTKEVGL